MRLRRVFNCLTLSVILGLGVWVEREAILRSAANLWIVSDPITPADAVVVLGGGIDLRPFVAADLYKKGLVTKILLSEVEEGKAASIGAVFGHTESNRRVLLKLGVPEAAIESFGTANKNTFEEVSALKLWTDHNTVSVLIIPTEIFSARRVSWILRREFVGTTVRIEVPSFDSTDGYKRTDWWKSNEGIIAFQNEFLKYIYYRWKY